jgi:predicted phosphodiesterase
LVLIAAAGPASDTRDAAPVGPMGGTEELLTRQGPDYGPARFMVATDLHILAPELWEEGPAFDALLAATDGKVVREAAAVLRGLEQAVRRESPDLLLLAGDLTFNGARASHELIAQALARIEASGVEVYVTAGNHDISNPWAMRYAGTEGEAALPVSPAEFREIYAAFGYAQAVSVHEESLAYLAEAAPGLRLAMLDSNMYARNLENGYPEGRGAISAGQRRWVETRLAAARQAGEAVLPLMHHSLLSHRRGGGGRPFGRSWIDLWPRFARLFWDAGAPVVLTGHAHEQDIAGLRGEQGEWVYDIATGSLGSYPHPYRILRIEPGGHMEVESRRLTAADFADGAAFLERSRRRYLTRFAERLGPRLAERYGLDAAEGYERARRIALEGLSGARGGDPPPAGNEITIDLRSGRWVPAPGGGAYPAR